MASIPSVISLLQNMRNHSPQQVHARQGMLKVSSYASGAYGTNVHSIKRMNSGASFIRLVGVNTKLVELVSNSLVGTGFSGNPLSMVPFRPEQSPLPWMYVADSLQMRKISMALQNYPMGVATPLTPPTASYGPASLQLIYDFSAGTAATDWIPTGTDGAVTSGTMLSDTIVVAIPDTPPPGLVSQFPQFGSILPFSASSEYSVGMILELQAFTPPAQAIVTDKLSVSWATTTLSSIVFDSGTNGPCTVTVPSIAQILPDHIIVQLGTGSINPEYVQVTGCVENPDGTFSFRCTTQFNHAPGVTITAEYAVRCYINESILASSLTGTTMKVHCMNSTNSTGTGSLTLTALKNLSTTNTNGVRPIQTAVPSDVLYLTIAAGSYANLTSITILLDVDATTNNFTGNYYYGTVSSGFPASGAFTVAIPISSLTRVGTDATRTLANVAAIRITSVTAASDLINYSSFWIGGQYGPAIGSGAAYNYVARARSTQTGARSNASPAMRVGLSPTGNGKPIAIYMPVFNTLTGIDSQVDVYDIYRIGGTITTFTYIGTMPNPPAGLVSVLFDVFPDSAIASNPQLETDNFQPFPTVDTPKSGTVNVSGTTVTWVSGDKFNKAWSQGTPITINGVLYSFYQQPLDTETIELNQVAGELTGVPYQINQATILGVPLPFLWGPFAQGTASFLFAVGDSHQPGVLFLTNGNNPDSASDILQIEITSPSEPLINGCMYDGTSFVFSSDRLFRLYPLFGQTIIVTNGSVAPAQGTNLFTPIEVPNGKGLFAPWGLAVGPKIWFIARDGIYETIGGEPNSLTDKDWAELFPHEGHPGLPVTLGPITVQPPDFTVPNKLRLSYYDSYLTFDFQDINGEMHSLIYDTVAEMWGYDTYTPGVTLHYGEEGMEVHSTLLAGNDGNVYQTSGYLDGDGNSFPCGFVAPVASEGTSRYQTTRNAYLSLFGPAAGTATLSMQMDKGPAQAVSLAYGTAYTDLFSNMPAMKGRLQQWFIQAAQAFTVVMRDAELGLKPWGDQGAFRPVDPFASMRRVQSPRSS